MSYVASAALQEAIFAALQHDDEVQARSGGAVFDAYPEGPVPMLYALIGAEDVSCTSDSSASISRHSFVVTVITSGAAYLPAKQLAAAISTALTGGQIALSHGALVGLRFRKARARRQEAERHIELRFEALIDLAAVEATSS